MQRGAGRGAGTTGSAGVYPTSGSGPFEPDTLLPAQFYATRGATGLEHLTGAEKLALAVIEDAIDCVKKGVQARAWEDQRRAWAAEARAWLGGEPTGTGYDCAMLCDVLGIDQGYLCRTLDAAIVRLREQRLVPIRTHRAPAGSSRTRVTGAVGA